MSLKIEEIDINLYELQQCEELFFISIKRGYTGITKYRKTFYKLNIGKKIFKDFISSI